MNLELSEIAADAMLEILGHMMDGGRIELMSENERILAILKLSDPAAMAAVDGELEFNDIAEEDAALAQGNVTTARILTSGGIEILSCDVGDLNSDAVIKLNTTKIYRGGPVRLHSFRLVMP